MSQVERSFTPEQQLPQSPLAELAKIAQRIDLNLENLGSKAHLKIWGGLHAGKIDDSLRKDIDEADIITLELPAVGIRHTKETKGKAEENPFWEEVIDYAEENGKNVHGANNNRASVNGIRLLGDRIRKDQLPFEKGPHMVISGRSIKENIPELSYDSEKMEPSLVVLKNTGEGKRIIDELIEGAKLYGQYSARSGESTIYSTVLRPIDEARELKVLAVSGKWASPMEFWMEYMSIIGKGREDEFPVTSDLVEAGIMHLLRIRGDKTQSKTMLKLLDKKVKQMVRDGDRQEQVNLLHIGGGIHNPNLLPILNRSISSSELITTEDKLDARAVPVARSLLSYFSPRIDIEKGLASTEIFEDQVIMDIPKSLSVLHESIADPEEVKHVWHEHKILGDYVNIVRVREDSGQFDSFYLEYLISLIPNELIEREEFPVATKAFIPDLEKYISINLPQYRGELARNHALYQKRKENFPLLTAPHL